MAVERTASPATAAESAKACSLKRRTFLPAKAASSWSSRMALSVRPKGERSRPPQRQPDQRHDHRDEAEIEHVEAERPELRLEGRPVPDMPSEPLVSQRSLRATRRTTSAKPRVTMAR